MYDYNKSLYSGRLGIGSEEYEKTKSDVSIAFYIYSMFQYLSIFFSGAFEISPEAT